MPFISFYVPLHLWSSPSRFGVSVGVFLLISGFDLKPQAETLQLDTSILHEMRLESAAFSVLVVAGALAALDDCENSGNNLLQSFAQARRAEKYHWQSGRGNFPNFAVSEETGPFELNESLSWSWHHPKGRFHTLTYGTALDHQLNVYLAAADGLRKFDKHGKLQWEHHTLPATLMNAPAIYQGSIFASDTLGGVRALSMSTGEPLWHTNVSTSIGEDNGFTMVHEGIVFTAADYRDPSPMGPANQFVKALNASNGQTLWTYKPDSPVWIFLPLFPDRESWIALQSDVCKVQLLYWYFFAELDGRERVVLLVYAWISTWLALCLL